MTNILYLVNYLLFKKKIIQEMFTLQRVVIF